jgi:hypothetical protein
MKCLLAAILIILSSVQILAQNARVDSLKSAMKQKPRFVMGLNNRFSVVAGEPIRVTGLNLGLDFNGVMRISLGNNWMPTFQQSSRRVKRSNVWDTIVERNRISYLGLTADYTIIKNAKWKFTIPILLGLGQHRRITDHSINSKSKVEQTVILPLEVGATAVYYIKDWIGIKAGLGNRISLGKSFSTTSGPYYSLGISIFAGVIYKKAKERFEK